MHDPTLLAADEGDPTMKVLIGIVFFLIWAGAQLLSWLANRSKDKLRTPGSVVLEKSAPNRPPQSPNSSMRRGGPPELLSRGPVVAPQRKAKKQPRKAAVPPPLLQRVTPSPSPVLNEYAVDTEAMPTSPGGRSDSGNRLRLLLQPANLRSTFLMTEILQKPISLREPEQR